MKTTSIPRLRRIRFKDGRTIEVFRPKPTDDQVIRNRMTKAFGTASDMSHALSGFAFVAWDIEGYSVAVLETDGKFPSMYVPDFARNRLLASKIEDWTIDTINGN